MSLIGSLIASLSGGSSGDKGEEKQESISDDDSKEVKEWDEEEEFRAVVQKYKTFIDSPRDEDGRVIKEVFLKNAGDLYHKTYMRYIHGEKECNFNECCEEMLLAFSKPDLHFKVFRYRKSYEEPRCMDIYLRFSTKDEDFVIRGQFWYENAMFVKSIQERSVTKKISGQASATNNSQLTQSGTLREFGCRVHELPNLVQSRVMGFNAGFLPVKQKYSMLRIFVEGKQGQQNFISPLLFWREEVLFDLYTSMDDQERDSGVDAEPEPKKKLYAGGAYARFVKRVGVRYMTFYSKDDEPVVFAEKKDQVLTIYGTNALKQDRSAPRMEDVAWKPGQQSNIVGFYPWFRIQRQKMVDGLFFVVSVLESFAPHGEGSENRNQGPEFEPLYKIDLELKDGSSKKQKVASVKDFYNNDDHIGVAKANTGLTKEGTKLFEVNVAPGVDPALMLMVALFLQDTEV